VDFWWVCFSQQVGSIFRGLDKVFLACMTADKDSPLKHIDWEGELAPKTQPFEIHCDLSA
jgi:hypothetical protein